MILFGETTWKTTMQDGCIVTNWEMSFKEVLDRDKWRKALVEAKKNGVNLGLLPKTAHELGMDFASKVKALLPN